MKIADMLHVIAKEYYFHIRETAVTDHGCLLETDCGTKIVSVWRDEARLRWAFAWREQLAEKGFRQVNRFIRTRKQAPYVPVGHQFLVVQDKVSGTPVGLRSADQWADLGELTGMLFAVFQDVSLSFQHTFSDHLSSRHPLDQTLTEKKRQAWKQELVKRDTIFSSLVGAHWASLEHRLTRARMLQATFGHALPFMLTLPHLELAQWQIWHTGCVGLSVTEPPSDTPSIGYASLARFLQDLFVQENGTIEKLNRFYAAFERQACLSIAEEYELLAQLIVPRAFFDVIDTYMENAETEDECFEQWVRLCARQEKLDQIHLWFAERLDRKKEESVSV